MRLAWMIPLGFLASPALAYDAHDYCRDMAKAERLSCSADYFADLAWCAQARAFDLSIRADDALADAADCRREARDVLATCTREAVCDE